MSTAAFPLRISGEKSSFRTSPAASFAATTTIPPPPPPPSPPPKTKKKNNEENKVFKNSIYCIQNIIYIYIYI